MLNTSNPDGTTPLQLGDQATPVTPTSKYARSKEREENTFGLHAAEAMYCIGRKVLPLL